MIIVFIILVILSIASMSLLIWVVVSASDVAKSSMLNETEILYKQYNQLVEFIYENDMNTSAKAILLAINMIDSKCTALLSKANFSEGSKYRYKDSIKELKKLEKNIKETQTFLMKRI